MAEEAKVRFLFRKTEHPGLRSSIEALKSLEQRVQPLPILQPQTILLPSYQNYQKLSLKKRNIFSIFQDDNDDTQGGTGIYNKDGSIKTAHISKWKSLPFKDRKAVIEERKRLGIRFQKKIRRM